MMEKVVHYDVSFAGGVATLRVFTVHGSTVTFTHDDANEAIAIREIMSNLKTGLPSMSIWVA